MFGKKKQKVASDKSSKSYSLLCKSSQTYKELEIKHWQADIRFE